MRIPDANIAEVHDQGYTLMEGFLSPEELAGAQEVMFRHFPRPEEYFAEPEKYDQLRSTQFAGLHLFPFRSWRLNGIALHHDLIDAAERYTGSTDVEFYKGELWAKYAGAIDYDQRHHRDYTNHTLVVPRRDGLARQMTCFILLSDVTELDGPTKVVPAALGDPLPRWPHHLPAGAFADEEIAVCGPAGSIFIYRTDIFHRGTDFGAPGRSRFVLLADYQQRGFPWNGKMSWPGRGPEINAARLMQRASVRQRDVLGFPPVGDPYWDEQTLADVAARYEGIDLRPYGGPGPQPVEQT